MSDSTSSPQINSKPGPLRIARPQAFGQEPFSLPLPPGPFHNLPHSYALQHPKPLDSAGNVVFPTLILRTPYTATTLACLVWQLPFQRIPEAVYPPRLR